MIGNLLWFGFGILVGATLVMGLGSVVMSSRISREEEERDWPE